MQNDISVSADSTLKFKDNVYRCALGRTGIASDKKEGDGATPSGCFEIRKVFYRADRIEKPVSIFETMALTKNAGWSDDSTKPDYNKHITLPYNGSHEDLWREDDIYDIIIVLGYNDEPVVKGKGSAVFMHITREGYSPTAGCIALSINDLKEILASCTKDTKVCITWK